MSGREYDLLDAVSMVSFILAVLNYGENLDQSAVDDIVRDAVNEIHEHLAAQDRKINALAKLLNVAEE